MSRLLRYDWLKGHSNKESANRVKPSCARELLSICLNTGEKKTSLQEDSWDSMEGQYCAHVQASRYDADIMRPLLIGQVFPWKRQHACIGAMEFTGSSYSGSYKNGR